MDDIQNKSVFEDWNEIETMFPSSRAMRPNKSWTNGISTRVGGRRLTRMLGNSGAGPLAAKLDQLDDARVKALRTFAAVNLEQATQGFRVTLIANVTVPVLILTVVNLLAPNGIGSLFLPDTNDPRMWALLTFVFGLVFVMLVGIAAYALASLNQARDIRHLIDLFAAERGIYFGLEDIEDMQSI